MGFGKKLQEKMDRKGIKQTELAKAVGIPKTTLSSMLSRDNTKVDIDVFLRICKMLDCMPEEFSEEMTGLARNIMDSGALTDEQLAAAAGGVAREIPSWMAVGLYAQNSEKL